jgi:uncharacterized protein (DUF58 family)
MAPIDQGATVLGQRQLYILPTRAGLLYALLLVVLLLAAINYSNGLAYGLAFLLASLAVVSMLHTHRNLHRLQVAPAAAEPVFAGEAARFPLTVNNPQARARFGVRLEHGRRTLAARLDLAPQTTVNTALNVPATARGYLPMPDFKVATLFPLGLFYAWSRRLRFDAPCLVYPRPAPSTALPDAQHAVDGASSAAPAGDDFVGQREYAPGDSPRHINWKAAARGQGWYTKQFGGGEPAAVWLDWAETTGPDTEARLSVLCRWVLDAEQRGLHYGLRLPGRSIEPAQGAAHQHECLKALALFNR